MLVLNLFGGPNTGKSTLASTIFKRLKVTGVNCELVGEYAKDMTYEKRSNILADQIYILAKQNRRLERMRGQVDIAIADSPLLLGKVYVNSSYFSSYRRLVNEVFSNYININFYLYSKNGLPYQKVGRNQTKEQAANLQENVKQMILDSGIPFTEIRVRHYHPWINNLLVEQTAKKIIRQTRKAFPDAFSKTEK